MHEITIKRIYLFFSIRYTKRKKEDMNQAEFIFD